MFKLVVILSTNLTCRVFHSISYHFHFNIVSVIFRINLHMLKLRVILSTNLTCSVFHSNWYLFHVRIISVIFRINLNMFKLVVILSTNLTCSVFYSISCHFHFHVISVIFRINLNMLKLVVILSPNLTWPVFHRNNLINHFIWMRKVIDMPCMSGTWKFTLHGTFLHYVLFETSLTYTLRYLIWLSRPNCFLFHLWTCCFLKYFHFCCHVLRLLKNTTKCLYDMLMIVIVEIRSHHITCPHSFWQLTWEDEKTFIKLACGLAECGFRF